MLLGSGRTETPKTPWTWLRCYLSSPLLLSLLDLFTHIFFFKHFFLFPSFSLFFSVLFFWGDVFDPGHQKCFEKLPFCSLQIHHLYTLGCSSGSFLRWESRPSSTVTFPTRAFVCVCQGPQTQRNSQYVYNSPLLYNRRSRRYLDSEGEKVPFVSWWVLLSEGLRTLCVWLNGVPVNPWRPLLFHKVVVLFHVHLILIWLVWRVSKFLNLLIWHYYQP